MKHMLRPFLAYFAFSLLLMFMPIVVAPVRAIEAPLTYKVGGWSSLDLGYLGTDESDMAFQTKISNLRLNGTVKVASFKLFAEFSFADEKIAYKNIYLNYVFPRAKGQETITLGYMKEPLGMSYNTSEVSYHFVTRPHSVLSLKESRALGLLYTSNQPLYFLSQGVFYRPQVERLNTSAPSLEFSGRWVYRKPLASHRLIQFGGAMTFSKRYEDKDEPFVKQGAMINNPFGYTLKSSVPDVKQMYHLNVEGLFLSAHYFVRGEFFLKDLKRSNAVNRAFNGQDIHSSMVHYSGAYIEAGALLLGKPYAYDAKKASLGALGPKSLELVARVNYTNLYDASLYAQDDEAIGWLEPRSDGGGLLSYTCGLNYRYSKSMSFYADYTHNVLRQASYLGYESSNYILIRCLFRF